MSAALQAELSAFWGPERLAAAGRLLVTRLLPLGPRDLEEWEEDAETYFHSWDVATWQARGTGRGGTRCDAHGARRAGHEGAAVAGLRPTRVLLRRGASAALALRLTTSPPKSHQNPS